MQKGEREREKGAGQTVGNYTFNRYSRKSVCANSYVLVLVLFAAVDKTQTATGATWFLAAEFE